MIDKKQLIEELLECVKDATDTETQITGLSMCATLMNEVLYEALTIPNVSQQRELLVCDCKNTCDELTEAGKEIFKCKGLPL